MEFFGNLWNAIGGLLMIIVAIEVLPGLLKRVSRALRYGRESKPDTRALADAYENADWVRPYYAVIWDLRVNWAPHVGGVMRSFSAPGLNIDAGGLRRTWNAEKNSPVSRIHAYGGSTMMGFGVRDDWTVPSLLSKKLNAAGHRVEVVNFGQPTYTATQAFIAFTEQLATGNKGEVTIFLDGLNEAITAEQNGRAGTVFNAAIRADEFNLMQPWRRTELLRHALDTIAPRTMRRVRTLEELLRSVKDNDTEAFNITLEAIEPLSKNVASHYINTLRMIRTIAEDNAIETLFFWQPSLFSKKTLSDYEQRYQNDGAPVPALRGDLFRGIYEAVRFNPEFLSLPGAVDVSTLFDDNPDPQFIDPFHLAEKGNNVLAESMLPHLIKALEANKD
jgi:lysophospholipase L1-like esterase